MKLRLTNICIIVLSAILCSCDKADDYSLINPSQDYELSVVESSKETGLAINFRVIQEAIDLLDPNTESEFYDNTISITHRGKTYRHNPQAGVKAPIESYTGEPELRWCRSDKSGEIIYFLSFCNLNPEDIYQDEVITIDWGYFSQSDEVRLSYDPKSGAANSRITYRNITVSGDSSPIEFEPHLVFVDYNYYDINITVSDSDGNDLLNPSAEQNILSESIYATIRDKKYYIEGYSSTPDILASKPAETALKLRHRSVEGIERYYLYFGDFSPEENYENEDITIVWRDKSSDKFTLTCTLSWVGWQPNVVDSLIYNGEQMECSNGLSWDIYITK